MTIGRPETVVAQVAAKRGGPFTHADARRARLSQEQIEQRVRTGAWARVLPGVYIHAWLPRTKEIELRAALLWAGPNAHISHRSAGELFGLDGVQAARSSIAVVGERHPRPAPVEIPRALARAPQDSVNCHGAWIPPPARPVIAVSSVLSEAGLRVALEAARRQRLTTVTAVRERFEVIGGRGRPGGAKLRSLLDV